MFRGVSAVQSRGQTWCRLKQTLYGGGVVSVVLVEVAVMQSVSLDRVSVDATNACKRWEEKAGPG